MKCKDCGATIRRGEWPFCPHGKVKASSDRWYRFENYVDRNIDTAPVEVTSPGHKEQLMKARGLVVRDREHISDLNQRRWTKGLPPLRS